MNKLLLVAICIAFCSFSFADVTNCKTYVTGKTDTCAVCNVGYGLTTSNTKCEKCTATGGTTCNCDVALTTCSSCPTDGQGLNADKSSCVDCKDANCGTCKLDYTKCTLCSTSGYGLDSTKGTCVACKDASCSDCGADYTTCAACKDGFAEDATSSQCTACANGCKTCENVDDSCTACPTGLTLNKNDTTNQFCCPANCSACSSTTKCTACLDGFNFNKDKGTCFGFKTGASLTLGAIVSVALFSLLF